MKTIAKVYLLISAAFIAIVFGCATLNYYMPQHVEHSGKFLQLDDSTWISRYTKGVYVKRDGKYFFKFKCQ